MNLLHSWTVISMIVKKIKDNKVVWAFRYRYKVDGVWKLKQAYNQKWTKRQAEEAEMKFIESLKVKTGDTLLFSELYDMYFAYKQDKLKVRAYRDIKTSCDRHILPYFSDKLLNDIKSHDIEKWQQTLLKATYIKNGIKQVYANRQLEKIQINMNAILKFAYDRELIDRNPFKSNGIVKRRVEPKSEEVRYITVEEFNRLTNAIELSNDDELVKAQDLVIFSILFWCGLRKGELMALDVSDYNFIKKELRIYKNYDYVNKLITTPKTTNSNRTVIVPDVVDEHIIRLVALYQKTYNYNSDVALISYHERIAPTTLTRKKDRYCKLAGLKGVTLHDFRHSHVSLLINSGLQPFEIAKRLGHTVEMVNEVYGHLYPSKQKEMVAMMNSIN
jgi:integrase